jgi:asparagine synthase (glutamine-hydrolysing)
MCGIAGIARISPADPPCPEVLGRMAALLRHRGPDGSGAYIDDRVGLAHTRLSVIDLSWGGQPIGNEDGSLWIVYNGEVFNHPELRDELSNRGHTFRTHTDTETVLHLYEEIGPSCLDRLNGQFAFAIWDSRRSRLFLARDRMGILPLHYSIIDGSLVFASEVKAVLHALGRPPELDPQSLDQVFTFWTTIPGRTAFKGVQELPPGHFLIMAEGGIAVRSWWQMSFSPDAERTTLTSTQAVENIANLLQDAIRIRLRADVPVGAYLSGGLDSSGLTALAMRSLANRLQTFGIRFQEPDFDEGEHQHTMVSFLGVDHREVMAANREIAMRFPEVIWHYEKPTLRTAPAPLFILSRLVRESGLKVVLTGEGADEVFGGYNIFKEAKIRAFWARDPSSAIRPLLIGRLYPYIFKDDRLLGILQGFFRQGMEDLSDPFYSHRIRWNNTRRLKGFYSGDWAQSVSGYDCVEELKGIIAPDFPSLDLMSRAQYLEMILFMSGYLLSGQGDRMAMAHSVETRPPYLDHRLVDLLGNLPFSMKMPGLKEKALLKRCYCDILPPSILNRPKHPYRAPIHQALLGAEDGWVGEALSPESFRETGIFDSVKVSRLLNSLAASSHKREMDDMALVAILSTHSLHKQFVSGFNGWRVTPLHFDILTDRRSASSTAGPGRGS